MNAERKYLLERVDDAAVAQVYADGFDELPLQQKILIWHLYKAALAGRDIYYDQRHPLALEIRGLLEAILGHPEGIDPAVHAEIVRYTKLFWINSGPYNNLTARKFVLKCTPDENRELWEAGSPISHVRADAPPTFVLQGTHDSLVWVEEARVFVNRLREVSDEVVAYAELPGAQHAFEVFHSVRTDQAVNSITAFLEWCHARPGR